MAQWCWARQGRSLQFALILAVRLCGLQRIASRLQQKAIMPSAACRTMALSAMHHPASRCVHLTYTELSPELVLSSAYWHVSVLPSPHAFFVAHSHLLPWTLYRPPCVSRDLNFLGQPCSAFQYSRAPSQNWQACKKDCKLADRCFTYQCI